ncbi:hypothetical protein niasHS_008019 [Heterodera schachtii]|uniref:Uncharacterized protein n=1 Tax=Heterodera schachtii TaxID=97005 RepID=A0ABD2J5V6_HETSC
MIALPLLAVVLLCLGLPFQSIAMLSCKVGMYTTYAAHIDKQECSSADEQYCIAYGCKKDQYDVSIVWKCSVNANCDQFNAGGKADGGGAINASVCECKIGKKGANFDNAKFTFPIAEAKTMEIPSGRSSRENAGIFGAMMAIALGQFVVKQN